MLKLIKILSFTTCLCICFIFLLELDLKAQSKDDCISCLKPPILGRIPACTPTPQCVPPQISLSSTVVNVAASIDVNTGTYTASANGILSIVAPAGSNLSVSGNGVTLSGKAVNFSDRGLASSTKNAYSSNTGRCSGMEPICAKPCNFGSCRDCNCALRGNGRSGHIYGWTDVYRYLVSYTSAHTVTATNGCGSASANFTINVQGNGSKHAYVEVWAVSPISLNLTGKKFNLGESRFSKANFHLTAEAGSDIYWFASEETPLLVWDPEKNGEIINGEQLFGNSTFGKKWETGYNALESLDKNKDKVLKLEELNGIRLWKDSNRNAISEKGEVVDLIAYGIDEISVEFNRQESLPIHGILAYISDKGFRYKVNGTYVWAESFDWIVPLADSDAVFSSELKKAEEQGYLVKEWAEKNFDHMNNRSYGYLMVKRESGDKLSGYFIKSLKSDNENPEYSLSAVPISGTWSDQRFDFVYSDKNQSIRTSETIKAFARVESKQIIPERLEIIHSQGLDSDMIRETDWIITDPKKPF
jgi:hypothetical protein